MAAATRPHPGDRLPTTAIEIADGPVLSSEMHQTAENALSLWKAVRPLTSDTMA
jgi:hypothetical protein